ncbi:clavesin-2-like isoform X2 [Episyrphus balteatus]|uniref:clavesin-2-like isoform X2 n=1 Tax=Episyrphus balteatus TaxID=286459 RepID=UPI002485A6D9|nr:clavesin-2-like isoform X2 [Episyrphus balteatus]
MAKIRPLNPALQKIAITELNEDPDNVTMEIASIRNWIIDQPKLGKYQISDQFILSFLRACKYNHDTVHRKLPNYLNMKSLCPEILANRRADEEMMDLVRTGFHLPLSMSSEKNHSRILLSQHGKIDLKDHTVYQGVKLLYMVLEMNLLEDDNTAVAGITCIEDLSGLTFGHVVSMNLMVLKRMLDFVRCGLPHRIKGVHIINAPWFANGIFNVVRTLLPAKIKSRVVLRSQ